jgi:DNA-binding LytR/AlgR family response regulator
MKYQCLVVDDEPIAQQILEKYSKQIDALHLVGKCSNAIEAMNMLHQEPIDILFLDINMPSLSGLDMLKTLEHPPKIILTTAYSEFGVESYDYGVTDYLLKPISFDRFLKAVNKILMPNNTEYLQSSSKVKAIVDSTFIFLKSDKKIHKYYYADILFIEGSGNYIKVHSQNEKPLMVLDKLAEIQEKLPQRKFLRVHKSFIVNVSQIQKIEGNRLLIKDNLIPISSTYKHNLVELISENK